MQVSFCVGKIMTPYPEWVRASYGALGFKAAHSLFQTFAPQKREYSQCSQTDESEGQAPAIPAAVSRDLALMYDAQYDFIAP